MSFAVAVSSLEPDVAAGVVGDAAVAVDAGVVLLLGVEGEFSVLGELSPHAVIIPAKNKNVIKIFFILNYLSLGFLDLLFLVASYGDC